MSKKVIVKIVIVFLFIIPLLNINISFATVDIDKLIEAHYQKIEVDEEGEFYVQKKIDSSNSTWGYSTSQNIDQDNEKVNNIVNTKVGEYIKKLTYEEYPIEKRIQEDCYIGGFTIYSITEETPYKDGDDIVALVSVNAQPVNGESNYWKENYPNYEFFYDEYENIYHVNMYYFVRLSISDKGEYEIAYIDNKPENYDKYVAELKETKGIDLENLDLNKILSTNYKDDIQVVSSSNATAINGNKAEYNSADIKEISEMSSIIREICIIILSVVVILYVFQKIYSKCKIKNN